MELRRTAATVSAFVIISLVSNVTTRPEENSPTSATLRHDADASTSEAIDFNPNEAYTDPTAAMLHSEVEVSISEISLQGHDLRSKISTTICTIYMESDLWDNYYAREMTIRRNRPKLVEKIKMPYLFGEKQTLDFIFHRIDTSDPDREELLGHTRCGLGKLVHLGSMRLELETGNNLQDYIIVTVEKVRSQMITLQLGGRNIGSKRWCQSLSPYIEIYKPSETSGEVLIHRTEVARTFFHNPQWRPITVHTVGICDGNDGQSLRFLCWHWDEKDERGYFIGEFETTLNVIVNRRQTSFNLKNSKKKVEETYTSPGQIYIADVRVREVPSFAEFVRGGLKIHSTIAIDFTDSNGEPALLCSLHHQDSEGALNPYEELLTSFGTVLEEYSELISVKGFGARFTDDPIDTVHHDFNVNLTKSPRCFGVQDILKAYRECLNSIVLSGPRFYDLIIRSATQTVQEFERPDYNYLILLILTNGSVEDAMQFKEAIHRARSLPISINIVSVGVETNDGNHIGEFVSLGEHVQFHRFSQHDPDKSGPSLAREVLGRVQGQVTSFMQSRGHEPKLPIFKHPPITDES